VAARVEEARDFARGGAGVRNEGVDDRRLAHAGLSDEHRGLPGERCAQRTDVVAGAELDERVAGLRERREAFAQGGRRRCEVGLVEDDQPAHRLPARCDQDAGDELVARARFAGDDHRDLGGVRGDQLPPVRGRTDEEGRARVGGLDHSLAGAGARRHHAVAAGVSGLLPARNARDELAAGRLDEAPAPVRGHDLAGERGQRARACSRAMRSAAGGCES
jgi:hypothetical protein